MFSCAMVTDSSPGRRARIARMNAVPPKTVSTSRRTVRGTERDSASSVPSSALNSARIRESSSGSSRTASPSAPSATSQYVSSSSRRLVPDEIIDARRASNSAGSPDLHEPFTGSRSRDGTSGARNGMHSAPSARLSSRAMSNDRSLCKREMAASASLSTPTTTARSRSCAGAARSSDAEEDPKPSACHTSGSIRQNCSR
ncbi:hypothetical protein DFJ74DRAFT_671603 [Hyaloraphidium curvatum]|nr:hypothetical protein DFJ74DRAFT_671603 [Hyaloraphidium curvatum]